MADPSILNTSAPPQSQNQDSAAVPNRIDRRTFLQMAALGTAAVATAGTKAPAIEHAPYYGALRPLPPGEVLPQGWLKSLLRRQADGLGTAIQRVSWPFLWPYWNGETRTEGDAIYDIWGPWEQTAYWVDGVTRLGMVLDDPAVFKTGADPIEYTLAHARNDGYIGPANFADPKPDDHRWPHTVFFRAVMAYAEYRNKPEIAAALRRHYLADIANYGIPTRNVTNIEPMLWVYAQTGDRAMLAKAEQAWQQFQNHNALRTDGDGDLTPQFAFSGLPVRSHGVSYAEQSKLPTILYLHTGNREYLKLALAAQQRIFDHHMLVDGIPSTSEFYAGRTGRDAHETCDITDHTWNWGYQFMATGDGIWGDRIERACFNAGLGAIRKDWKGLQYFSSPNQVLATRDSNHLGEHQLDRFDYAPNPGLHIACCGGNIHRLFPNYALRMWMKSGDDGLAATLYGPCRLRTKIAGQWLEIIEETNYPFEEQIQFAISAERPIAFPLRLRIPRWCTAPAVRLNGKPIASAKIEDGFLRLHRTFTPGDRVTLHLPMRTTQSIWPENGVALERGPLAYSLPIQARWEPVALPHWSTQDYPIWNAKPASAWNYALAPGAETVAQSAEIVHTANDADPWLHPPVSLRVPAKRLADWKLITDSSDPNRQFTPPLPSSPQATGETETISLVPLGSTELRLTVFPLVQSMTRE